MPKFSVEALDVQGALHRDTIEAETAHDAVIALRQQGLHVYAVKPAGLARLFARSRRPLSAEELSLLSEQLASLVQSGLPLAPALKDMALEIRNRRLAGILRDAQRDIENGRSLEEAFGRHSGELPPIFFSLLRAGEQTGNLPAVLRQLTDYAQGLLNLKYHLQAIFAYPLVLFVFLLLYLGVFANLAVTQFEAIYHSFGRQLPAPTRLVLQLSHAVSQTGFPLILFALAGVLVIALAGRATSTHSIIGVWGDALKFHVPWVGGLYRSLLTARFCRTLGILLSNGANIMESLPLAGAASGNRQVSRASRLAAYKIGNGATVSEAIAGMGLLKHSAAWILKHGESNGALEQTLLRIAEIGDRNAARREQHLLGVLGPVMVTILGIVVGASVTALFMPILQLSSLVST